MATAATGSPAVRRARIRSGGPVRADPFGQQGQAGDDGKHGMHGGQDHGDGERLPLGGEPTEDRAEGAPAPTRSDWTAGRRSRRPAPHGARQQQEHYGLAPPSAAPATVPRTVP